jgi:hypothetical protein
MLAALGFLDSCLKFGLAEHLSFAVDKVDSIKPNCWDSLKDHRTVREPLN